MAILWVCGAILGAEGSRVYASINRLSATLAYLPPAIIVLSYLFKLNRIFRQLFDAYSKFDFYLTKFVKPKLVFSPTIVVSSRLVLWLQKDGMEHRHKLCHSILPSHDTLKILR